MDPRFAPARKLQEKAKNPKADSRSGRAAVRDLSRLGSAIAAGDRKCRARARDRRRRSAPPGHGAGSTSGRISVPFPGGEPAGMDASASRGSRRALPRLAVPRRSASRPGGERGDREAGLPFGPGSSDADFPGLSQDVPRVDPGLAAAGDLSPHGGDRTTPQERGRGAELAGDKQQAIEIWSRIFLIDINNAEAVTRIEDARREMAEESRRVAAALEKGQESFARGDLAVGPQRVRFRSLCRGRTSCDAPPASHPWQRHRLRPPFPRTTFPPSPRRVTSSRRKWISPARPAAVARGRPSRARRATARRTPRSPLRSVRGFGLLGFRRASRSSRGRGSSSSRRRCSSSSAPRGSGRLRRAASPGRRSSTRPQLFQEGKIDGDDGRAAADPARTARTTTAPRSSSHRWTDRRSPRRRTGRGERAGRSAGDAAAGGSGGPPGGRRKSARAKSGTSTR